MTTRPPKASGRLRGCLPSPDTTLCPWNRPFLRVSGRLSGIAYEPVEGKTVAPAPGPLLGNASDAPDAQTGIDPARLFGLQPQTPQTPQTPGRADESGPGTMGGVGKMLQSKGGGDRRGLEFCYTTTLS